MDNSKNISEEQSELQTHYVWWQNSMTTRLVKIWVIGVICVSLLILLVELIYSNSIMGYKKRLVSAYYDEEFIKSITPKYPKYPPPLFNFA